MQYNHHSLEEKYRKQWVEQKLYTPKGDGLALPYYNLMMFPYPSAEGLHVGNMYAFTGADVHGRFRRQQGFDVFEPIGLDGFGIHSENFAIKIGKHPAEQAKISQENFYRQLNMIGNGFAWEHRLETYDPDYYKWTQWLFAELFRQGLAYRGEAKVNWCPSCKTVLADEQVEDGKCERCKSTVERKTMTSWYLKITEYADRLLDNIDQYRWTDVHGEDRVGLDWPKKVTIAQKNWIGRSTGLDIDFAVEGSEKTITVWTKFWETVFGVTYLVVAPEYPLLSELVTPENQSAVNEYIQSALQKTEQDRKTGEDTKTGVFTGSYVINPVNGKKVPVWVADYVLTDVGTGAVMGVPSHDARDFAFAGQFALPVVQVVEYADPEVNADVASGKRAYEGEGMLVNSGEFSGQDAWGEGKEAIKNWLMNKGWARIRTDYHLRDWLISRQRYWGPPIPMLHCQSCEEAGKGERAELPGWYAVPTEQLPVELPFIEKFQPEGEGSSPLDNAPDSWKYAKCPGCGGQAVRETDVSDTFLDSSWYFLRYPWVNEGGQPFVDPTERQKEKKPTWFPVDAYIGGAEHAVLHLLYARFVTMALHDWGMLPAEEPFPFLFGHGLIIKDGAKMSKSKGNVINPDDYIQKYGADALRTYLMFLGPYDQGGDFRDTGMHAMHRWLSRVWETLVSVQSSDKTTPDLESHLHRVIKANTADMAQFKFNTCIARLMEFMNDWRSGKTLSVVDAVAVAQLLAPFAPYLTEGAYEHFQQVHSAVLGDLARSRSIHTMMWPAANEEKARQDVLTIALQVNGKLRGTLEVDRAQALDRQYLEAQALENEGVQRYLENKPVRKVIVVPERIVNIVV